MNKSVRHLPIKDLLIEIIDNRGKSVPTVENGFPLIATNCIKHSSIYPTFDKVRYVDEETMKNWFRAHLKPNDILFVNKGTPGRVCLVPDPVTFCAAQDMMGFRCNDKLISYKYLFAALRSHEIQKIIENNHVGLVIPHFRKQDLSSLLIPVKSRIEQDFIGDLYILLSEKIELNNSINAELETMAKTLYDYWFVQFDFPVENGEPYKTSGGKMVWNEELKREIPEGWEVESIEKSCSIIDCLHSKKSDLVYENQQSYLLQLNNILDNGLIDLTVKYYVTSAEYKKWTTRVEVIDGDIVITNAGRVAATAQIPMEVKAGIGRNITAIRPMSICHTYLFLSFQGADIKRQIKLNTDSGAFFTSFNVKGIKKLQLIRANKNVEEQFEKMVLPIRRRRELNNIENQKLAELRDWLLPMLMNGQVTVS
jgi:type I restriction enzyme S subunit